jgi:transposase-like protein
LAELSAIEEDTRLENVKLSQEKFHMLTLQNIYRLFPSQIDCLRFLCQIRWPKGIDCLYCRSRQAHLVAKKRRVYCPDCHGDFSPLIGTIFYRTKLPLQKWFWFLSHYRTGEKASIRRLARVMDVNKLTVVRLHALVSACSDKDRRLTARLMAYLHR